MATSRGNAVLTYGEFFQCFEGAHLISDKPLSWERIEELITLIKFDDSQEHSYHEIVPETELTAWRKILEERWERIKGTNLAYPYNINCRQNILCMILADMLQPCFNQSRFLLLMPDLNPQPSIITGTDLMELQLSLTDFVLSDDKESFIEVKECVLTAVEDGILKHTHHLSDFGQPLPLSESEVHRVIHHSTEANALFAAIKKRYAFKHEGSTVGACINMLIEGLRAGGALRNGSEMNAGVNANIALLTFSEVYAALPEIVRTELNVMRDSTQKNFLHYWRILAVEQQEKIDNINKIYADNIAANKLNTKLTDTLRDELDKRHAAQRSEDLSRAHANTATCVQLTATGLELILNENKKRLFEMSINGIVLQQSGLISEYDETLKKCKVAFEAKIKTLSNTANYRAGWIGANEVNLLKKRILAWLQQATEAEFNVVMIRMIAEMDTQFISEEILPALQGATLQRYWELNKQLSKIRLKTIAAGLRFSSFLMSDGELYGCEFNKGGQLELIDANIIEKTRDYQQPFPPGTTISRIAHGPYHHSLFLTTDGQVYGYGSNRCGQLGMGDKVDRMVETRLPSLPSPITQISAGISYSLFLTTDGHVYGCGDNMVGQLGMIDINDQLLPMRIPLLPNTITQICTGYAHSLFLTAEGQVYGCGRNEGGWMGPGSIRNLKSPVKLTFPSSVIITQIAAGFNFNLFLSADGRVYPWGNEYTPFEKDEDKLSAPAKLTFPWDVSIIKIAAGPSHGLFLTSKGEVYGCGCYLFAQMSMGFGDNELPIFPMRLTFPFDTLITNIIAGGKHSFFLTADGRVYGCSSSELKEFAQEKDKVFAIIPQLITLPSVSLAQIRAVAESLQSTRAPRQLGLFATASTAASENITTSIFDANLKLK